MVEFRELYRVTTRGDHALVFGGIVPLLDFNKDHSVLKSVDYIRFDPSSRELLSIDFRGKRIKGLGRIPIIHFHKYGSIKLEDGEEIRDDIHIVVAPVGGVPGKKGVINWVVEVGIYKIDPPNPDVQT